MERGRTAAAGTRWRESLAVQIRKQELEKDTRRRRLDSEAPSPSNLAISCQGLGSSDPQQVLTSLQHVRHLLSCHKSPPIQQIIDSGAVPHCVSFLNALETPQLQFEAAWVLTNIAAGSTQQTRYVVEQGALPVLVHLLRCEDPKLKEQAVWALGNIAGTSVTLRDFVLERGTLSLVLSLIRTAETTSIFRHATWTLSNLCRGQPAPSLNLVGEALPLLVQLLDLRDAEAVANASWALKFLSDGPDNHIQALCDAQGVPNLVRVLNFGEVRVQLPALRALHNIVTSRQERALLASNCGLLVALLPRLASSVSTVRRESCNIIAHVSSLEVTQVEAVVKAGITPSLIHLVDRDTFDCKKAAAGVLCNMILLGSRGHLEVLVSQGCLRPMIALLGVYDTQCQLSLLGAFKRLLDEGHQDRHPTPIAEALERNHLLEHLDRLDESPCPEVYELSRQIQHHFNSSACDMELADDLSTCSGNSVPSWTEVHMNDRTSKHKMHSFCSPCASFQAMRG